MSCKSVSNQLRAVQQFLSRFTSTDALKQRILDVIDCFNQTLAKPCR